MNGRQDNKAYRTREYLTADEIEELFAALKQNRWGHRDHMIGLITYRHGLRASEVCDLRWDDLDWGKSTILVRRLKGSITNVHPLQRDEQAGLKRLAKEQDPKSAYVFTTERGGPFDRAGVGAIIKRAGVAAGLGFPVHIHMLRHSCGYALAAKGRDTRTLQAYLGHASITSTVIYTAMSPNAFKNIWG
jgi:integrase